MSKKISLTHYRRDIDDDQEFRPLEFRLIRRIFSYTAKYPLKRNLLIALVVARSIQLPLTQWAVAAVISGPITGLSLGDVELVQSGLFWGVAGFAVFALLADWMFHYRMKFALEIGESVVNDLRNEVFRHLQRMPMSFFNRTKLGRIISRMTSDIESVRAGVQDVFFICIVQGGQMLVAGAMMMYYNLKLFGIIVALAPILYAINRYFRKRLSIATRAVQESMSRVTSTLAESVNGIRVTQGFAREETNAGLFKELVVDHSLYNMKVAKASTLLGPLLEVNGQLFVSILLVVGGSMAIAPQSGVDIGDLIKFYIMAGLFFSPLVHLANQYNSALVAMAGAERVFRLLDTEPEWVDDPDAQDLDTIRGQVEFRDVHFRYDAEKPVLKGISFVAKPGETVAFVGHTGSGKSSTINLIAKFYLADAGAVLIDGIDMRKVSSASLHRRMGIVLQANFLFSGTVMENVRFGRPEATDAEVVAAVESLGCLDIIESLPLGFQSQVGERGASLSLGQKQLICFARAMIADPRILILDEATSSIDTLTEARLQRALEKLTAGRTCFVVAHRLSTIRHAAKVILLDHGLIAEEGSHDELVARGGAYAALYKQFAKASRG